jgi:hypothetical protein
MKHKYFILVLLVMSFSKNYAQELVQVTDEVITVNSTSSLTGYTRNKTEVILPEKTISYIYRISIFPKGKSDVDNSLFDLLKSMGSSKVSLTTSFAEFAIKNNDSEAIDAFIFNNTYDADNFYTKKDNNWSACKSMMNRVSCCFATKECIGNKIYFGFRNNNIRQGLDVKIEIVALVDKNSTAHYKYAYSINNDTNVELTYSISLDNQNWVEKTLRSGYLQNFSLEQKEIYFRISSANNKIINYKLTPNERYKIFWNIKNEYWDLNRY